MVFHIQISASCCQNLAIVLWSFSICLAYLNHLCTKASQQIKNETE